MQYKPPLELSHYPDHATQINSSIIWLHGLGADGHDFAPIAHYLLRPDAFPNTRFVLPHAPAMPVTRNNGYIMPAWYDVYGITPISKEDAAGIKQSQQYIEQLIDQEIKRGIPSNRIVLAGFSQGGAIALHCAIRYSRPLAAVLALSTYLPLKSSVGIEKMRPTFKPPSLWHTGYMTTSFIWKWQSHRAMNWSCSNMPYTGMSIPWHILSVMKRLRILNNFYIKF